MMTAVRRATYQDVLAAPPNVVAEVIDGVLHTNPRPATPHAAATSALGEELGPPFKRGRGGPGGWLIVDEPELHLAEDIVVPDLAGWRRERLAKLPDAAFVTVAPDWVCEALSERTRKVDRTDKMRIWARESVSHVWLIDPIARTLEVLRREGTQWLLLGTYRDEERVRAEPFDAIELDLALLWADVEATEPA
ncbi:MAG TPA: Uma2 family endonuclease [Polyangiaceae bacterium]